MHSVQRMRTPANQQNRARRHRAGGIVPRHRWACAALSHRAGEGPRAHRYPVRPAGLHPDHAGREVRGGFGIRNHDSFVDERADERAERALADRTQRIAGEGCLGHRHTAHQQTARAYRASDRGIGGRKKKACVRQGRRNRAQFRCDRAPERRVDFFETQLSAEALCVCDDRTHLRRCGRRVGIARFGRIGDKRIGRRRIPGFVRPHHAYAAPGPVKRGRGVEGTTQVIGQKVVAHRWAWRRQQAGRRVTCA